MKKSKDITKYNLKWQMVRSSIKGTAIPLAHKIIAVNDYFDSEKTKDARERVLNYLEGLQMGYTGKDPSAVKRIQIEIDNYRSKDPDVLMKEPNGFITFKDATAYSHEERFALWKDLFRRNQKWLEKGYVQKEINDFMDVLYQLFQKNHEKLGDAYSFQRLEQLRKEAAAKPNTHKFFF